MKGIFNKGVCLMTENLIPGTYMVEAEILVLQVINWPKHMYLGIHMHTHKQTREYIKVMQTKGSL